MLLLNGADVNSVDGGSRSALLSACWQVPTYLEIPTQKCLIMMEIYKDYLRQTHSSQTLSSFAAGSPAHSRHPADGGGRGEPAVLPGGVTLGCLGSGN